MKSFAFDWFRNIDGDNALLGRNIAWCYHYFRPTGLLDATLAAWEEHAAKARGVFHGLNIAYNHYGWAHLFDKLDAFPLAHEYFMESCQDPMVFGYELSRAQTRAIGKAGKTYVNIKTHPVRFLPDYLLCASTNDAAIHSRLLSTAPPRSYVDTNVSFHKARAARRYQRRINPEHGAVFFAQIAFDSSRIRNGEFLDDTFITVSVEQFLDENRPKNFYVKHHPHEKMPPALIDSLKSMGARPTETNTYDLLSVEGLRICALSSSVCHEAAYFGCRPTSFYPTREFPLVGEHVTVGDCVMLPVNIYQRDFWEYILHGGDLPAVEYPMPSAPFRSASGLAWG
jgi:hypothetical protein